MNIYIAVIIIFQNNIVYTIHLFKHPNTVLCTQTIDLKFSIPVGVSGRKYPYLQTIFSDAWKRNGNCFRRKQGKREEKKRDISDQKWLKDETRKDVDASVFAQIQYFFISCKQKTVRYAAGYQRGKKDYIFPYAVLEPQRYKGIGNKAQI